MRNSFIVALTVAGLAAPIGAQTPDLGQRSHPEPLPAPKYLEPATAPLGFELPDAGTLLPDRDKLSSGLLITIREFRILGNTAFPPEQLQAEALPYLDRPIGNELLEELRLKLTRRYLEAGYINSGALIPDQEVSSGIVTIQIVEGSLGKVEVEGEHRFAQDYIESRLRAGAATPLKIAALQERMQLMLQNPQIERMNAELAPGSRPGESTLRVAVHEAPRYTLGASLANNRSPNVGADRLELQAAARNLLGIADTWSLRHGKTRGIDDLSLSVGIPVTPADTTLEMRYERNMAAVIEEPFSALDITSRSENLEIGLRHPLYRTLQNNLTLGLAVAARNSTTWLDGERFSFSPGVHNGNTALGVMRLSAEWLDRGKDHVFSVRGVWNRGLDTFGATRNPGPLPDARFDMRLLQLQWVGRLNDAGASLLLRGDMQSSRDPLFSMEKFSLGGADSVRGFRENQLIRDNGWLASAELRWPVAHLPVPFVQGGPGAGQLSLALFADAGKAWDRGGRKEALWGIGPGLRWEISQDSYAQIYWAGRRKHLERETHDLQDRGVHFKLVVQTHF